RMGERRGKFPEDGRIGGSRELAVLAGEAQARLEGVVDLLEGRARGAPDLGLHHCFRRGRTGQQASARTLLSRKIKRDGAAIELQQRLAQRAIVRERLLHRRLRRRAVALDGLEIERALVAKGAI